MMQTCCACKRLALVFCASCSSALHANRLGRFQYRRLRSLSSQNSSHRCWLFARCRYGERNALPTAAYFFAHLNTVTFGSCQSTAARCYPMTHYVEYISHVVKAVREAGRPREHRPTCLPHRNNDPHCSSLLLLSPLSYFPSLSLSLFFSLVSLSLCFCCMLQLPCFQESLGSLAGYLPAPAEGRLGATRRRGILLSCILL